MSNDLLLRSKQVSIKAVHFHCNFNTPWRNHRTDDPVDMVIVHNLDNSSSASCSLWPSQLVYWCQSSLENLKWVNDTRVQRGKVRVSELGKSGQDIRHWSHKRWENYNRIGWQRGAGLRLHKCWKCSHRRPRARRKKVETAAARRPTSQSPLKFAAKKRETNDISLKERTCSLFSKWRKRHAKELRLFLPMRKILAKQPVKKKCRIYHSSRHFCNNETEGG